MLAAAGAPYQRAVARIEFLDAVGGLDHFRPRHARRLLPTWTMALAHRATMPMPRKAAVGAPTSTMNRYAGSACIEHGAHDFRDSDQTGVAYAGIRGFSKRQHRIRWLLHGALEQADQLGAMHFAHAPPMKPPSCAATKTVDPCNFPVPITTPSSKTTGASSCPRCGLTTRSEAQELFETVGIEQSPDAFPRIGFEITGTHAPPASTPRLIQAQTDDGRRRPMSLTEMRVSASCQRS